MLWFAEVAATVDADRPHVINDSKTPSGRVHVGALRGPVLHDALFRALKERGVPVKYIFGVDDYDPLDEEQKVHTEFFAPHLGRPLCDVPAPPGSDATDIAEHYIREFFDVFRELGIGAEIYRMRDMYRTGKMNEAIDAILRKGDVVRGIYKEISGAEKSERWLPFQIVCEVCKKIGTTEVTSYDGKEVEYACRPNLVKWAKGCGHHGKTSPFDGRGKLPWKLEWPAKWRTFGVTIEGAGKDHTTKGGARDVANACYEAIFGGTPPLNIHYEFFTSQGKKMSSSRGVGTMARDMANFLPPDVLRYLILRTQPASPVEMPLVHEERNPTGFALDEDFIVKLFNDFDRLHKRTFSDDPKVGADEKELYRLCEVQDPRDHFDANFQLILTFVQMPHVDLVAEIEKRKGDKLTDVERSHLDARVRAARYWLDHFAREEQRVRVQDTLPARAAELGQAQRGFLHVLASTLEASPWEDDALQAAVFDAARRAPIDQGPAFKALYRVLLDRDMGPRAGALMAVLDRAFILARLRELSYDEAAFLAETAIAPAKLDGVLAKEKAKIADLSAERRGDGLVDVTLKHQDGKVFVYRVKTDDPAGYIEKTLASAKQTRA